MAQRYGTFDLRLLRYNTYEYSIYIVVGLDRYIKIMKRGMSQLLYSSIS